MLNNRHSVREEADMEIEEMRDPVSDPRPDHVNRAFLFPHFIGRFLRSLPMNETDSAAMLFMPHRLPSCSWSFPSFAPSPSTLCQHLSFPSQLPTSPAHPIHPSLSRSMVKCARLVSSRLTSTLESRSTSTGSRQRTRQRSFFWASSNLRG